MRVVSLFLSVLALFVAGCGGGTASSRPDLNDRLADSWELVHVTSTDEATLELWSSRTDSRCAAWVSRLVEESIAFLPSDCNPTLRPVEVERRDLCVTSAKIYRNEGTGAGTGDSEEVFCFYDLDSGPDIALYPREDVLGACLFLADRSKDGHPENVEFFELVQKQWAVYESAQLDFVGVAGIGWDSQLVADQWSGINDEQASACLEAAVK